MEWEGIGEIGLENRWRSFNDPSWVECSFGPHVMRYGPSPSRLVCLMTCGAKEGSGLAGGPLWHTLILCQRHGGLDGESGIALGWMGWTALDGMGQHKAG
jgi:hypothetical protein